MESYCTVLARVSRPSPPNGAYAPHGGSASAAGYLPLNVMLVNWFVRRRATTMGLMASGMGIDGLLAGLGSFVWAFARPPRPAGDAPAQTDAVPGRAAAVFG